MTDAPPCGHGLEIIEEPPRGRIRCALLDLDGTVSLLRDGWQDCMVPMMVEVLEECPEREAREELEAMVIDFVDHLTGKQTIYQMLRLVEEVKRRGGVPLDPLEYKRRYHERLSRAIEDRLDGLREGLLDPARFLVAGAVEFLRALRDRGIRCCLASGTDVEFVRSELQVLGIADWFDGGIHGALSDYQSFSKAIVIGNLLSELELRGPELLVVGDGYVEIRDSREVGAVAFGLFTRENNRYHMNADKKERLIRAGVHLLAPDLRAGPAALGYLDERSSRDGSR